MPSPTRVAKYLANLTVFSVVASQVAEKVSEHTDHSENDVVPRMAADVAGVSVTLISKPYTDAAVDKAATWLQLKKEARAAKKESV